MFKRFYVDTCIWRDYAEDRVDHFRPLGEFAFRFFKDCESAGHSILYSSSIIEELKKAYSIEKINCLFEPFQKSLVEVPITREQAEESRRLAKIITESHRQDILHAILARDNRAVIVTRDKGFESLVDIAPCAKPEEINQINQ